MSKYSEFFLVGSPSYCELGDKLRLRSYGSWLAEEAWCREEQNKKRAKFSLEVIRLAKQIALKKEIGEDEAFDLLQTNGNSQSEIFNEFASEINALMALAPSGRDQFEEIATIFFKNRGEVLNGKKWMTTEDWTKEDTQKLPQTLLRDLEEFMAKEDGVKDASDKEDDFPK